MLLKRIDTDQEFGILFGILPRVHRSTNKQSTMKEVLSQKDKELAVNFIMSFAEKYAVALPSRFPDHKSYQVVKLLPSDSKISVYRKYVDAMKKKSLTLESWVTVRFTSGGRKVCHTFLSQNHRVTFAMCVDLIFNESNVLLTFLMKKRTHIT